MPKKHKKGHSALKRTAPKSTAQESPETQNHHLGDNGTPTVPLQDITSIQESHATEGGKILSDSTPQQGAHSELKSSEDPIYQSMNLEEKCLSFLRRIGTWATHPAIPNRGLVSIASIRNDWKNAYRAFNNYKVSARERLGLSGHISQQDRDTDNFRFNSLRLTIIERQLDWLILFGELSAETSQCFSRIFELQDTKDSRSIVRSTRRSILNKKKQTIRNDNNFLESITSALSPVDIQYSTVINTSTTAEAHTMSSTFMKQIALASALHEEVSPPSLDHKKMSEIRQDAALVMLFSYVSCIHGFLEGESGDFSEQLKKDGLDWMLFYEDPQSIDEATKIRLVDHCMNFFTPQIICANRDLIAGLYYSFLQPLHANALLGVITKTMSTLKLDNITKSLSPSTSPNYENFKNAAITAISDTLTSPQSIMKGIYHSPQFRDLLLQTYKILVSKSGVQLPQVFYEFGSDESSDKPSSFLLKIGQYEKWHEDHKDALIRNGFDSKMLLIEELSKLFVKSTKRLFFIQQQILERFNASKENKSLINRENLGLFFDQMEEVISDSGEDELPISQKSFDFLCSIANNIPDLFGLKISRNPENISRLIDIIEAILNTGAFGETLATRDERVSFFNAMKKILTAPRMDKGMLVDRDTFISSLLEIRSYTGKDESLSAESFLASRYAGIVNVSNIWHIRHDLRDLLPKAYPLPSIEDCIMMLDVGRLEKEYMSTLLTTPDIGERNLIIKNLAIALGIDINLDSFQQSVEEKILSQAKQEAGLKIPATEMITENAETGVTKTRKKKGKSVKRIVPDVAKTTISPGTEKDETAKTADEDDSILDIMGQILHKKAVSSFGFFEHLEYSLFHYQQFISAIAGFKEFMNDPSQKEPPEDYALKKITHCTNIATSLATITKSGRMLKNTVFHKLGNKNTSHLLENVANECLNLIDQKINHPDDFSFNQMAESMEKLSTQLIDSKSHKMTRFYDQSEANNFVDYTQKLLSYIKKNLASQKVQSTKKKQNDPISYTDQIILKQATINIGAMLQESKKIEARSEFKNATPGDLEEHFKNTSKDKDILSYPQFALEIRNFYSHSHEVGSDFTKKQSFWTDQLLSALGLTGRTRITSQEFLPTLSMMTKELLLNGTGHTASEKIIKRFISANKIVGSYDDTKPEQTSSVASNTLAQDLHKSKKDVAPHTLSAATALPEQPEVSPSATNYDAYGARPKTVVKVHGTKANSEPNSPQVSPSATNYDAYGARPKTVVKVHGTKANSEPNSPQVLSEKIQHQQRHRTDRGSPRL